MKLPTLALLTLSFSHLSAGCQKSSASRETCARRHVVRSPGNKTTKLMGYYPSFNSEFQSPQSLDYRLYTDLIFFVAVPNANLTFSFPDISLQQAEHLAKEFVREAEKQGVKPLLAFGGWTGSRFFSDLSTSDRSREQFAKALVTYTQKLGFCGIDFDWEYPNGDGIGCNSKRPADTVNFGKLLKEVRKLWPQAQLSAALSILGLIGQAGGPATSEETVQVVNSLDYVNLMAYDVYGNWASTTGPLAPISNKCADPASAQSIETGLAALASQGFRNEQIVLGIPGYARSFELTSPDLVAKQVNGTSTYYYQNHTAIAPQGGRTDDKPGLDVCGKNQTWAGIWLVQDLVSNGWLSQDQRSGGKGYTRHFDECSGMPFLTNGKKFLSYDDEFSTVAKARFATANKLAGIYFYDTLGPLASTVRAARMAL